MRKAIITVATLCFFSVCLLAQEPETLEQNPPVVVPEMPVEEDEFQQRIEALIEDSEDDIDVSDLLEELELLRQRPLNLNHSTADELRRLYLLSEIQINNLILHRSRFGNLISMLELQTVEGFDAQTIDRIRPFVFVSEVAARRQMTLDDVLRRGTSQLFIRYQQFVEEQKGFSSIDPEELEKNPNARYLGSPYRLYSRYRFTYYNNLSVGITAEKDPGEEFFKGSQQKGFDFYSAHFYVRDFGKIKSLALGDFQVQFGQGLTLWSGLAFGKSSEAVYVKKNGLGLRPYTSVDENNYMRGAGTTLQFGKLEFTAFYSGKNRDANVIEVDAITQEALVINSLQQTGLHRTPRELSNKNSIREEYMGGNITFRNPSLQVGVTGYIMELGAEFKRNLSFYNQFDFNSKTNWNLGTDYNYVFKNFNFFGEIAMGKSDGYAFLNGVMMSIDPRLSLSVLHRKFLVDYQSVLSVAFSENTRVSNENGLFFGLNAKLSRTLSLNAYADHFSFPWMKFRTYSPSRGYDYLAQINYRPERRIEIYARYRIKNKPLNSPDVAAVRYLDDQTRQNFRLHFSYPISPSFTLKNRLEWIEYAHGNKKQNGFLIYQDITYRNFASPLSVTFRYALFDTDGYDSRIYAYENDVLYAFSFPFYSEKGHRAYMVVRYRLNRFTDIQARVAQTFYTNRNSIGSGLDMINGNSRTEIKGLIRFRF